ncbi:hypothetical protein PG997_005711 [Apiospora hydei]|uniref:Uncharacterized protein n=1 Tax=Apiospora hydei TaxID=1337664 RepID=A0ABR1WPN5_9PEZI
MCVQQYTTLTCPGCGYHYPYRLDIPIHCPESLMGSEPGFGTCLDGVKQTYLWPPHKDQGPPKLAGPAAYGRSQERVRSLFEQVWSQKQKMTWYHPALREYALTCLFNPNELMEGAFDPRVAARSGGGHYDEIRDAPIVREGGYIYETQLKNLGEMILFHDCADVCSS